MKNVVCAKFCYYTFWFLDCIAYFNETCLFSLFFVLKSKDIYAKIITWHYIVISDWINIMGEWLEVQGVLCKMLRGNLYLYETHKTDPYDWLHGSIQNILATSILKNPFCQNNPKNWICFLVSEIIWCFLKTVFILLFIRWETNHSSNSYFEVTKQFWTKKLKMKMHKKIAPHVS
jgi:hypothetical protein